MSELPSHLKEILKTILREEGIDPETKYTIKDHHFRLWVSSIHKIIVHRSPSSEENNLSLFFKRLPENPEIRVAFNTDMIFENEIGFYNDVLSPLLKFQENKCVKNPFNAIPKCYKAVRTAEDDVIVLEDLGPQGFIMLDRHKLLGLPELHLLMKELGRFHALCLAMKHQEPENFKKVKTGVKEIGFSDKFIEKFGVLYDYVKNDAVKLLKQHFPQDNLYVRKLEQYANNTVLAKRMQELVRPKEEDEPYNVFNHRDIWINNLLYKYSDEMSPSKEPIALKLLDFQGCQYSSPGLDVSYVLLNSADKQIRDQYGDSLLHSYYDNFRELLSELGSDPQQVFPYEVLKNHIKKYSEYGLWMTILNLPHTLDKGESVEALNDSKSNKAGNDVLSSITGAYTRRTEECDRRLLDSIIYATSKYCDGGHYCSPPKECCTLGCCYMYIPGYRPPAVPPTTNVFSIVFWNHWYFWCILLVLVVSCVGGCSLWRRWRCCCCCWRRGDPGGGSCDDEPSSERESAGSCYPPPQYSRCSSFHHAPPPYTEVTSKPDLYPLVISYGDNGKGGTGGNYLMVQYFRNYIVRPVGSLSATSTADSLSSSFLCNAANEANTIIPPPYSCAGSLDEFQTLTPISSALPPPQMLLRSVSSITSFNNHNIHCSNSAENLSQSSPHQNISLLTTAQQQSLPSRSPSCLSGDVQLQPGQHLPPELLQHQQSYMSATALSTTGSDVSSLAGVGTPGSPPRATSPTLEIRELLDKIQQLPFQQPTPLHEECSDYCVPTYTNSQSNSNSSTRTKRYRHRGSGKNLYMPLGLVTVGSGSTSRHHKWLPRSAPTTPSTHFPPPFLANAVPPPRPASSSNRRRQSSGTAKEDGSPLLAEHCSDDEHEQDGEV